MNARLFLLLVLGSALLLPACRRDAPRERGGALSFGPLPDASSLTDDEERFAEAERLMMAGQEAMEHGSARQAEAYLQAGLQLRPEHEFLWLQWCILMYDTGRFAEAEEACTRAIDRAEDPKSPNYDSVLNRGLARVKLGKLDAAESDFQWNKRMQPKNAEAYYDESWVWAARGDLDKVIENVGRAGEYDPYYASLEVVGTDQPYDKFRDEPRWVAFLETLDKGPAPPSPMSRLLEVNPVSGVPLEAQRDKR